MTTEFEGGRDASGKRFGIAVSRYSPKITEALLASARSCLVECGAREEDLEVFWVPGTYELTMAALWAAETGRFDAVLALGCVVRGETAHDRYISSAVADGLTQVALDTDVPVLFGVITANTPDQAVARSGRDDLQAGKGWEAALAAVEMVGLAAALGRSRQE